MKISRKMSASVVLVAALGLAGCANVTTSAAQLHIKTESAPKEAGLFSKDTEVCFTNSSGDAVTIQWVEGTSTTDGEGTLDAGEIICGEGSYPTAIISYQSGFQTKVETINGAFSKPSVMFFSNLPEDNEIEECDDTTGMCYITKRQKKYASFDYAQGQSIANNIEGHQILVTREADDSWINFLVEIQS